MTNPTGGITGNRVTPQITQPEAEQPTTTATPTGTTPQSTTTQSTDGVDTQRPVATGVPAPSLEQRVIALQTEIDTMKAKNEQARVDAEIKEAEELKKPGFGRTIMEVFEFFGRFFTPFFNLVSLIFRVLRIGMTLLKGEKVDWKKEGVRLLGDIAGVFFPPAGAIVNAGANLWFNESELLGGVNKVFDGKWEKNEATGKDEWIPIQKESGIRATGEGVLRTGKRFAGALEPIYDGAKGLLHSGASGLARLTAPDDSNIAPIKGDPLPVQ